MKKLIALLLALCMVLGLVACGNKAPATDAPAADAPAADAPAADAPAADEPAYAPIKVGVLVADVSGEEALAFRAYYENYLAPHYNVTLTYTEQLAKVQHTSNLYYTEPCAKLARLMCEKTGMKKVFFG